MTEGASRGAPLNTTHTPLYTLGVHGMRTQLQITNMFYISFESTAYTFKTVAVSTKTPWWYQQATHKLHNFRCAYIVGGICPLNGEPQTQLASEAALWLLSLCCNWFAQWRTGWLRNVIHTITSISYSCTVVQCDHIWKSGCCTTA